MNIILCYLVILQMTVHDTWSKCAIGKGIEDLIYSDREIFYNRIIIF